MKIVDKWHYPNRLGFLCLVSIGLAFLFELIVTIWALISSCKSGMPIELKSCLAILPKYCLWKSVDYPMPLPETTLAIIKVFFLAALVSLFYEVYKSIIEWYRCKYISESIYKKFKWIYNRKTGANLRYIPWYRSFSYLKTRLGLTDDEIIKACAKSNHLRVADLSSTRSSSSYQYEKFVVECYWMNRPYGAMVNKNSKVTIVVAATSLGLSKFGFYLAFFGGFNFISKEVVTGENFFNVSDDTKKNSLFKKFFENVENMTRHNNADSLVILLTAYKYKKDKKIYLLNSSNECDGVCVCSEERICRLSDSFSSELGNDFQIKRSDNDTSEEYYLRYNDIEKNLLYEIGCGPKKPGVVIGIPANINVWDMKRIKTIQAMASAIKESSNAVGIMAQKRIGFDFPEYIN